MKIKGKKDISHLLSKKVTSARRIPTQLSHTPNQEYSFLLFMHNSTNCDNLALANPVSPRHQLSVI